MNKEILETKWGEFASLDAFAPAPLQDGRFSVQIDEGRFECLYVGSKTPDRLFVLLSGARNPESHALPKFDRWSWQAKFPGAMLCISDPTLYVDERHLRIGWYVGTKDHDWMDGMARLVRAVAARIGLPTAKVVTYGSSAGGFGSLVLAARLGDATAVAINPQTNALHYFENDVKRMVKAGFGVETAQDLPQDAQPRFSAIAALAGAPAVKSLVVQNLLDRHHYRKHFLPWCEASGAPRRGGVSKDGRFRTVLYESPDGHGPEPRTMVADIVAQAVELADQRARPVRRTAVAAAKQPAAAVKQPAAASKQPAAAAAKPPAAAAKQPAKAVPAEGGAKGPIKSAQIYLLKSGDRNPRKDVLSFSPPGRADVEAYTLEFPLDWDVDPFVDRNWCGQLHMWRPMDDYLLRFEATGDQEWLDLPLRMMDDWHRYHLKDKKTSRYAWLDMMTGLRAMKLAFVLSLQQSGAIALSEARQASYLELVDAHLKFLLDPENVAFSNHTFFDIHGVMALAQVVGPAERQRIHEFVGTVLPKLISSQFNQYGLHLEHSPEYHPFGMRCLLRLQVSGWFEAYRVGDLLKRALVMDNWLRLPDGRVAPLGDSNGSPPPAAVKAANFQGRNQVMHNGGYVIVRDDGGGTSPAQASYLFFMGAFNSRFHKQPDDLSFIWFEGEDILCDAGKYAYKSDLNRDYVLSTRAHNTVEIDQKSYWNGIAKDPDLPYGSAIEAVTVHEWGHMIAARVEQKRFAVQHARYLLYAPGNWVLVVDRLSAADAHEYTQWFHFAPGIRMKASQPHIHEGTLGSGRKLTVRSECSATLASSLVRGQKEPRMQGWISQKYRELQENDALGLSANGKDVVFATLLSLDDQGSSVRLDDRKIVVSLKTAGGAPEKLVLALGDRTCRVRQA